MKLYHKLNLKLMQKFKMMKLNIKIIYNKFKNKKIKLMKMSNNNLKLK